MTDCKPVRCLCVQRSLVTYLTYACWFLVEQRAATTPLQRTRFWPFQPHKNKKQEEQMLKRSIFARLSGLLGSHLLYIINHDEHLSCFMQLFKRMTAWVPAFLQSCDLEWTSRSFKLEWNCSLVVLSITPSLQQIGSQVSWHMTMLNVCFIKSHLQSSLPRILLVEKKKKKKKEHELQQAIRLWQQTEFNQNWYLHFARKWTPKFFYFSYNCDLGWRSRSSKLISTCRA